MVKYNRPAQTAPGDSQTGRESQASTGREGRYMKLYTVLGLIGCSAAVALVGIPAVVGPLPDSATKQTWASIPDATQTRDILASIHFKSERERARYVHFAK